MTFRKLPPRPPMLHPQAAPYAEQVMAATVKVQDVSRCILDIAYGDDYWQKLDIYLPADTSAGKLPVLMFLHGGAWTGGYKEWMGFMAPLFTAMPAIFISVSYRLSPESKFPDALHDAQDALAWAWRHVERYGGDPDKIAIGGHSAGGHLAALAALETDGLASRGLPRDCVKLCLPVSATFDLRAAPDCRDASQQRAYRDFLAREQDDAQASPILYAGHTRTAFFIAWGDGDFSRIKTQGPAMARVLKRAGTAVLSLELKNSSHFDTSLRCAEPGYPWTAITQELLAAMPAAHIRKLTALRDTGTDTDIGNSHELGR